MPACRWPAGSVLFNATFLIDGAFRPGYGTLRQPMSALSLGHGGWVQVTNFIVFGALTCLFGDRLARDPDARGWVRLVPAAEGHRRAHADRRRDLQPGPRAGLPAGGRRPSSSHAACADPQRGGRSQPGCDDRRNFRAGLALPSRTALADVERLRRSHRRPHGGLPRRFGANMDHGLGGMFEKLASITALVFTVSFTGRLLTMTPASRHRAKCARTGRGTATSPSQRTGSPKAAKASPWRWWLVMLVIAGALLTATGGLLALHPAGEHLNSAGRNYAEYFFTRNLGMAVLLVVTLGLRARRALVHSWCSPPSFKSSTRSRRQRPGASGWSRSISSSPSIPTGRRFTYPREVGRIKESRLGR